MTSDLLRRLEEIKARCRVFEQRAYDDILWLIEQVESLGAQVRRARNDALEEAALVTKEDIASCDLLHDGHTQRCVAAAIRALKNK